LDGLGNVEETGGTNRRILLSDSIRKESGTGMGRGGAGGEEEILLRNSGKRSLEEGTIDGYRANGNRFTYDAKGGY